MYWIQVVFVKMCSKNPFSLSLFLVQLMCVFKSVYNLKFPLKFNWIWCKNKLCFYQHEYCILEWILCPRFTCGNGEVLVCCKKECFLTSKSAPCSLRNSDILQATFLVLLELQKVISFKCLPWSYLTIHCAFTRLEKVIE